MSFEHLVAVCIHVTGQGLWVDDARFGVFDLRLRCPYYTSTNTYFVKMTVERYGEIDDAVFYGRYPLSEGRSAIEQLNDRLLGRQSTTTTVCVELFSAREPSSSQRKNRQTSEIGGSISDRACVKIHP
jgi:hypothetical protein